MLKDFTNHILQKINDLESRVKALESENNVIKENVNNNILERTNSIKNTIQKILKQDK